MFSTAQISSAARALDAALTEKRSDEFSGSPSAVSQSRIDTLRADVERLFMITEALWTVLKAQHGYTDDHLTKLIQDVDLRDGQLNGHVQRQPHPLCPECGRTLIGKSATCLYCGTAVVRDPFER